MDTEILIWLLPKLCTIIKYKFRSEDYFLLSLVLLITDQKTNFDLYC